jgi:DNA-binding transcriptional LysR family regulator
MLWLLPALRIQLFMHKPYPEMNNIDWDGFRYFVAAAETGSLSAAAKRLKSNQPTVGRYIDSLESALGVKLFQRHMKGLTLTLEGARVLEQSRQVQSSIGGILRTIQGEESDSASTVRIALPEGLCMEMLIPALPEFYRHHPNISLVLEVSASAADLARGAADIAIRLFRPTEADLVVKRLGAMRMGVYASAGYCSNHGIPSIPAELRQHRTIAYGERLSSLPENRWLTEHSDPALCILRSDNTTVRLKATAEGLGVSVQPEIFSRTNQQLVRLLEGTAIPGHEVWLACHQDIRHTARIRAVAEFISSSLNLPQ